MASGEIEVIPGRVLSAEELVDNQKLNDLGTPILRVKPLAITSRELADGTINSDKLSVDLEAQLGVSDNSVTTNKIVDNAVTPNKMSEEARIPIGVIMDFAGTIAPSGWLLCGGQLISRATYAALFSVIGTAFGAGDGVTTFGVPDLRGRVVAGKDDMVQGSANRLAVIVNGDNLAAVGGAERHTVSVAEMPSHAHSFSDYFQRSDDYVYPNGHLPPGQAYREVGTSLASGTAAAGGSQPHNNVQPTIILNKIIRYF
jgi:microcystin-dependent protein